MTIVLASNLSELIFDDPRVRPTCRILVPMHQPIFHKSLAREPASRLFLLVAILIPTNRYNFVAGSDPTPFFSHYNTSDSHFPFPFPFSLSFSLSFSLPFSLPFKKIYNMNNRKPANLQKVHPPQLVYPDSDFS